MPRIKAHATQDNVMLESEVASLLAEGTSFDYHNKSWIVKLSGKPVSVGGSTQPKTDVYVQAQSGDDIQEFKISIKKRGATSGNASFIETKIKPDIAAAIFEADGVKWQQNLINYLSEHDVLTNLNNRPLLDLENNKAIIGWRLDIVINADGLLCTKPLKLSSGIRKALLSGAYRPADQQDGMVNGVIIPKAAIASHLLSGGPGLFSSAQSVFDAIHEIDDDIFDFHAKLSGHNYIGKYSQLSRKMNDHRALVVAVDYSVELEKLHHRLVYNRALYMSSEEFGHKFHSCLGQLGMEYGRKIDNVSDITREMVFDKSIIRTSNNALMDTPVVL